MQNYTTVDEYIKQAGKEVQPVLKKLRATIKKAAPKAKEKISYGMPFYEYGGTGYKGRLVYFGVFKKHISLFIPPGFAGVAKELQKFRKGAATYQFPIEEKIPFKLIEKSLKALVKLRDKMQL